MHRLYLVLLGIGLTWQLADQASATDFRLTDGTTISGEVASASDQGIVIRLTTGGFSERIGWVRFTQETLKGLAKDPKTASFAEPYIELPPEEKAKAKRQEIVIKAVPRPERPEGHISLLAAFSTPAGLAVLVIFMAANLLAAYEIAVYRNQPAALVCAVSMFVPVLGPIIFLSLPTRVEHDREPHTLPLPAEQFAAAHPPSASGPAAVESQSNMTSRFKNKITELLHPKPSGGLRVVQHAKATAPGPTTEVKIFKRGDVTFNRRFFETQFPGFFRIVPGETEKDMVLLVKAARGEYVGRRISRISANEIGLQLQSGGASAEVLVPFVEINEVQLRHKDTLG